MASQSTQSVPSVDGCKASRRYTLIVIHGVGGTFADAVELARGLLSFECAWDAGDFLVHRRMGTVLRRLLQSEDDGHYARAYQSLAISRFLAASPEASSWDVPPGQTSRFSERRLRADFGYLGLPVAPGPRARRARELKATAVSVLDDVRPRLSALSARLLPENGARPTEREARSLIRELAGAHGDELVDFLESLRDMQETGGDLDTVASAALYAHWIRSQAPADAPVAYGRDYRFIFLNYHEDLAHLDQGVAADILMADLPIGAFPDFAEQARRLHQRGMHVQRYEDHHPYTPDHLRMFEALKRDGVVGFVHLCGHVLGEPEDPELNPRCGAALVYENSIKGTAFDCPGARRVCELAHAEDYVTDRTETSRALTSLIKGGHCKVELAQLLLDSMAGNDLDDRLDSAGWRQHVIDWRKGARERSSELEADVLMLHVVDAEGADETRSARVVMTLAPPPVAGAAALHTGAVTEFMARRHPGADYLFYCYGERLLVGRRLNSRNVTVDLSLLMPIIGTESDGGHSGAAVCRPDANPAYPHRLLGRVTHANFAAFSRYLSRRLASAGLSVIRIEDLSAPASRPVRAGQGSLLIVVLASLLLGLGLIIFSSRFRPRQILESNADFRPQIEESQPGDDRGEEGGEP